jgi:hypothetical protein
VQVLDNITLGQLHWIIQLAMGWTNSHLHSFEVGKYPLYTRYGAIMPDLGFEDDTKDEEKTVLNQIVQGEKFKFFYVYDFGDNWEHEILVEKILPIDPQVKYPICIKSKRACPPDDCGGVWGYIDLIDIIQDPEHPDHESMLEWVGGSFDPEACDLKAINEQLQELDTIKATYSW